jgi:hypothetical protein
VLVSGSQNSSTASAWSEVALRAWSARSVQIADVS